MKRTFQALDADPARQAAFRGELLALIATENRSGDASMVVPSEYLEVVVEKAQDPGA